MSKYISEILKKLVESDNLLRQLEMKQLFLSIGIKKHRKSADA